MVSTYEDVTQTLEQHRILPVVTIADRVGLAKTSAALLDGGLPILEITLRTPYALTAIELASRSGELLVGAGSVNDVAAAEAAVSAGARFLVSPGFAPDVAEWCRAASIPLFPGVATASEVLAARAQGARTVKFFPASASGGPQWIRAVSAPIQDVMFLPTGGVDGGVFEEYLRIPGVLAVGGSWFLRAEDNGERAAAVADTVRCARASATGSEVAR